MYLWIKALHVVAIISWMAGLLYLPRLFVYHSLAAPGPQSDTFKIMERKLLKFIMQPAMYVAWITGAALAVEGNHLHSTWFHLKVGLVLCLTAAHIYDAVLVRRFASGENRDTDRFYRMLNEVPTVLMIGIVVLVIVKPF